MSAQPIRMVVFDIGGVLVRICRNFTEGCEAAGLDVRIDPHEPESREHRREISRIYQNGDMTCDDYFTALAKSTSGAYSVAEVAMIHDAWLLGEYDGVIELIERIHDAGLATGILSNTNHRHWQTMQREYRFIDLVEHPHASHLLRRSKPHETIYAEFESRTGIPASNLLFFDDLDENVTAARGSGWQSERIDHTGDTATQMRSILESRGAL